ncbi:hypothetical protein N5919_07455 [Glaesserella parasuis]|uniref:hypothetical protein n=1 Tax=Glaesserella parasuis TaxID=738 RepID=UPI001F177148|nr:hypothetical protein [Glaesserella parasuis]MDD2170687.1 hypothetical protein [Glaesserella parasuis]MDP0406741.1 hypothetical protein [Glaesserella parasuis]
MMTEVACAEDVFIIDSQIAFEQYLLKILTECDLDKPHFVFPKAEFKGWPILHFNVKGGKKYQSTVTSYLIEGLKDFTDEIFRAICVVKYGKPDLRYLKENDRAQFDIVLKIVEGSSDGEGSAENIANSFFTNMNSTLKSMSGWKQFFAFVSYIGVLGGTAGFLGYQYFQSQTAETKAQVEIAEKLSDNTKAMMEAQANAFVEMSRQQNETMQALLAAKADEAKTVFSEELKKRGELASESFMKQIAKDPVVTEATVQETTAKGKELEQYKHRATTEKSTNDKADDFYIKGVERVGTLGDTLSITAQRVDNIIFTLKVKVEKLQDFEKNILTNELIAPEEQRQPIRLAYKETMRNGKKSGTGELISVAYKEVAKNQ